jgi:serine/threonine protein kinase
MTPRYRMQRVLGRGRHAGIWLAHDAERGTDVAVKIATKVAPHGSFAREFEIQKACAGDHVVAVFEHGQLPDAREFIAMEWLPRGSVTQEHAPAVERVERVLHEAAAALARVHRGGWVHRDVKPAHLLLRADGDVALCDFGSACRAGTKDHAATPRVIGTPRYAAPEQIEGAAAAPTADVYSLGACAFELLTGKPPFRGETLTELFSQHVRAPVPRLPRELAQWQPLLDAMLAKDPAQRPADGEAVLARMESMIGAIA